MPVYNPGSYLSDSISSLLAQTYEDFELLLIDDGSSRRFKKYIKCQANRSRKIRLLTLGKNKGGGNARNHGLEEVRGKLIAFCDSDDRWPKKKLERHVAALRNDATRLSHSDMTVIDERGNVLFSRRTPDCIDLETFLSTTALFCSSVVLKREVIGSAQFGTMAARHPFKFWCEILRRDEVSQRVDGASFYYLKRQGSVSSGKLKMVFYTVFAYFFYSGRPLSAPYFLYRRFCRRTRICGVG